MNTTNTKPTVVLVHGAWADGSSWMKLIALLQARGVATMAAPIPLTSLSDDAGRSTGPWSEPVDPLSSRHMPMRAR